MGVNWESRVGFANSTKVSERVYSQDVELYALMHDDTDDIIRNGEPMSL